MVGLSTSDRRDEGGPRKWQLSPIALAIPYSLSGGSGRPSGLRGLKWEMKGNRIVDLFNIYTQ